MPKFAANLTWLFKEHDFLERFTAARAAGFEAVEFLFPYAYAPDELRVLLEENTLQLALFNMPPGDFEAGDRGLAIDPARRDEFMEGVETALTYANALACPKIHCMAGIIPDDADPFELEATYVSNLKHAAARALDHNKMIVIEPLNTFETPGYFLTYTEQAARILEKVGADNLKIQFDVYHAQRMEGELAATLCQYKDQIGHIQVSDNPGRHEPGTGEINYRFIFEQIDKIGYDGWVGCEYAPQATTQDGLAWRARLAP